MFEATTSLDSIKGRDVAHEELIHNSFQSEQAWVWSGLLEMVTNGSRSVGNMETKERRLPKHQPGDDQMCPKSQICRQQRNRVEEVLFDA
jgi:hypothetical protein